LTAALVLEQYPSGVRSGSDSIALFSLLVEATGTEPPMGYQPIENYGIIGDLHTVALVGMDGSIDFMCAPRFDSASVFAALLDDEGGGRFQLAPLLEEAQRKQLYLPDTCVLLTRFLGEEGVAEVSDFMPVEDGGQAHNVVRRAKTVRGEVRFRMVCQPRFDYARAIHTVEQTAGGVRFIAGSGPPLAFLLRSSVPVRLVDGAAVAEFTLRADESVAFVFRPPPTSSGRPKVWAATIARSPAR
jgi:GH15 family glucan-1,4-alpha-glucosidase